MWEYVKGSEADFEGLWTTTTHVTEMDGVEFGVIDFKRDAKALRLCDLYEVKISNPTRHKIIAERRKVDDLQSRVSDANLQQAFDTVQRPAHYNQSGIECIDAIAAAVKGKSGIEAACVANVIKYLWRYQHKNGVEDCRKAQWYLDRLVKELSK